MHELLREWLSGLRLRHIVHGRTAARCERRGRTLGIITVAVTALVGTSIFADLGSSLPPVCKVAAAALSAVAVVLAGLQNYLNYPEFAKLHQEATRRYAVLRRDLELALMQTTPLGPEALKAIQEHWSAIERESPIPPQDLVDAVRDELAGKGHGAQ